MRYRGQVVDRLGRLSSHQTRWYTTWEAAHHAADEYEISRLANRHDCQVLYDLLDDDPD